ncbi:hypothetical protein Caci_5880 [Catenulispora acidiphila DSM 44928]|uniref:Secreted protein n=1 Tax=Catenulispora acidiphila (strain DSM 44928 / JCM 14897 / NBRC 102108 / NRRL B-24433 / ID139908) TaxID=479433 RepID=C7QEY0_CATAD|nr:hypothetical protein [Catenulispora acidiphila]ACU74738.1 hypothetical protein Caci_5880 [Catenulispora acidiphila DSM 44928]
MKRVMIGLVLAATGLFASVTFATTASATTWDNPDYAQFTNWYECNNWGQMLMTEHKISAYECFSNGTPIPGGPGAYMSVDY